MKDNDGMGANGIFQSAICKSGDSITIPGKFQEIIYVFYDDSFLIFFYVYVSLFYDAFFFYHKAYSKMFFIN